MIEDSYFYFQLGDVNGYEHCIVENVLLKCSISCDGFKRLFTQMEKKLGYNFLTFCNGEGDNKVPEILLEKLLEIYKEDELTTRYFDRGMSGELYIHESVDFVILCCDLIQHYFQNFTYEIIGFPTFQIQACCGMFD